MIPQNSQPTRLPNGGNRVTRIMWIHTSFSFWLMVVVPIVAVHMPGKRFSRPPSPTTSKYRWRFVTIHREHPNGIQLSIDFLAKSAKTGGANRYVVMKPSSITSKRQQPKPVWQSKQHWWKNNMPKGLEFQKPNSSNWLSITMLCYPNGITQSILVKCDLIFTQRLRSATRCSVVVAG